MRQISIDAANALIEKRPFIRSNTKVVVIKEPSGVKTALLLLHDNEIASYGNINGEDKLRITTAGYETVTTRDRLNALPGVCIHQKNWKWYLNDFPWNGDWICPDEILLRTFNVKETA